MLVAWRVGLWVAFSAACVGLTFWLMNPIPVVVLSALSFPAERWVRSPKC